MKTVLVCEDEASIRSFVVINLKRAGYTVLEAASGEEALQLYDANGGVDIALLDVMLPAMDGFEVCRIMRARNVSMGIIMLTARTQESEKVSALQMGADDYVTKPFGTAELIARVDALYRRLAGGSQAISTRMECGEFVLDLRTRQLLVRDVPIELTHVEYQIMEYFLRHTGEEISRADILRAVWGPDYYGEDKIVDVNMHRLRMKIESDPSEPKHIITVWGRGYKWNG